MFMSIVDRGEHSTSLVLGPFPSWIVALSAAQRTIADDGNEEWTWNVYKLDQLDDQGQPEASDRYNGWTNRETWAVHLYLTNDQHLYETWMQRIEAAKREPEASARHVECSIAEMVRLWWEELAADMVDSNVHRDHKMMVLDVGSLWRVDWMEVAKTLIGD